MLTWSSSEADCSVPEEARTEADEREDGTVDPVSGGSERADSDTSTAEDVGAELAAVQDQNRQLMIINDELTTRVSSLEGEVSTLTDKLTRKTERVSEVWRMSCEQVSVFDETISAKYSEIE